MFIGFIVKQKTAAHTSPIEVCAAVLQAFSYTLFPMLRDPMQPASKKYHTIGGNHSAFAFANIVQSLDINKRYGENVACVG